MRGKHCKKKVLNIDCYVISGSTEPISRKMASIENEKPYERFSICVFILLFSPNSTKLFDALKIE